MAQLNNFGAELRIIAINQGKERLLAVWQWPSDGPYAPFHKIAHDGRRELEGFWTARDSIRSDDRRSELAKTQDVNEQGRQRLQNLGKIQQRLLKAIDPLETRRNKLAEVERATPEEAVVDVAIAQRMQSLTPQERSQVTAELISGASRRLVMAVLRLPTFLTGFSDKFQAQVAAAEIRRRSPGEAGEVEAVSAAAEAAQDALRATFKLMVEGMAGAIALSDQMEILGESAWRHLLPGDPDRMEAIWKMRHGLQQLDMEAGSPINDRRPRGMAPRSDAREFTAQADRTNYADGPLKLRGPSGTSGGFDAGLNGTHFEGRDTSAQQVTNMTRTGSTKPMGA